MLMCLYVCTILLSLCHGWLFWCCDARSIVQLYSFINRSVIGFSCGMSSEMVSSFFIYQSFVVIGRFCSKREKAAVFDQIYFIIVVASVVMEIILC